MKKLSLTAVLVVAMLFSLAGCGNSDYKNYTEANNKVAELQSYDIGIKATMSVTTSDNTMNVNMPIEYSIKVDNTGSETRSYSYMKMSILGLLQEVTTYTVGDTTYQESKSSGATYEDSIKVKYTKEEFVESESSMFPPLKEDAKLDIAFLEEDDFKDIQKEQSDDGSKYTITKTGDEVKAYFNKIINSLYESFDITEEEKNEAKAEVTDMLNNATIGDVTIAFVIKDGYFTQFDISAANIKITDIDPDGTGDDFLSAFGDNITLGLTMNLTYNNPGQSVTISLPSDLDDYIPYSELFSYDFDF